MPKKAICPRCGNRTGVEIVYGFPGSRLFEQAERGEIALGGCEVNDNDPDTRCDSLTCGWEW